MADLIFGSEGYKLFTMPLYSIVFLAFNLPATFVTISKIERASGLREYHAGPTPRGVSVLTRLKLLSKIVGLTCSEVILKLEIIGNESRSQYNPRGGIQHFEAPPSIPQYNRP